MALSKWTIAAVVLCTTLVAARPAEAQFFDPDNKPGCWSCYSHNSHFAVSAVFDVAIRPMPIFAKSWRRAALGRVAIVTVGGILYEFNDYRTCATAPWDPCGSQVGRGFGPIDIMWDVLGAASVETVQFGLTQVFRKIHF